MTRSPAAIERHWLRSSIPRSGSTGRSSHPDASAYEGPEGFLRFSETDWEAFEDVVYEPQDFLSDGAYVIVTVEQSGIGKSSALAVEERIVNVWKLRRGKCV